MHGQRKFDRNLQSAAVGRHVAGASGKVVGHERARVDVVAIVVSAVLRTVDVVRHARPLGVIACPFETAGQSAGLPSALYVAHAAAEPYGICRDNAVVVGAPVCQNHAVVLVAALVEVECSEVYPGAAAHPLVYAHLGFHALVPYRVCGVIDAVGQRGVAHIHRIAPFGGQFGHVRYDAAAVLLGGCLSHTRRAGLERVLSVAVCCLAAGETFRARIGPFVAGIHLYVARARLAVVVVHYHFVLLPVAFAWREHNGSRVFEHGDEVGDDDGLGEKVFSRAEELGSLPAPPVTVHVIVSAVACPQRYVPVLQPVGGLCGVRHVLRPRFAVVVGVSPHPRLVYVF